MGIKELIAINVRLGLSLLIKKRNTNPAWANTVNTTLGLIIDGYRLEDPLTNEQTATASDIEIRLLTYLIPDTV